MENIAKKRNCPNTKEYRIDMAIIHPRALINRQGPGPTCQIQHN